MIKLKFINLSRKIIDFIGKMDFNTAELKDVAGNKKAICTILKQMVQQVKTEFERYDAIWDEFSSNNNLNKNNLPVTFDSKNCGIYQDKTKCEERLNRILRLLSFNKATVKLGLGSVMFWNKDKAINEIIKLRQSCLFLNIMAQRPNLIIDHYYKLIKNCHDATILKKEFAKLVKTATSPVLSNQKRNRSAYPAFQANTNFHWLYISYEFSKYLLEEKLPIALSQNRAFEAVRTVHRALMQRLYNPKMIRALFNSPKLNLNHEQSKRAIFIQSILLVSYTACYESLHELTKLKKRLDSIFNIQELKRILCTKTLLAYKISKKTEEFFKTCKGKVKIIGNYNQGDDDAFLKSNWSKFGWCHSVVICWLAHQIECGAQADYFENSLKVGWSKSDNFYLADPYDKSTYHCDFYNPNNPVSYDTRESYSSKGKHASYYQYLMTMQSMTFKSSSGQAFYPKHISLSRTTYSMQKKGEFFVADLLKCLKKLNPHIVEYNKTPRSNVQSFINCKNNNLNLTEFINNMELAEGVGTYIGLDMYSYKNGYKYHGHAVATYTDPYGYHYYFDPNRGVYKFEDDEIFKSFIICQIVKLYLTEKYEFKAATGFQFKSNLGWETSKQRTSMFRNSDVHKHFLENFRKHRV
ncbi:MAG: hypothetical protein GY750_09200 [Lentisphaerae bacterium]|nr:hypothetical protein [Lentisphaerota bacterium]MCP4101588.1 hypothetical protein [Lentisphaerota bacterium]